VTNGELAYRSYKNMEKRVGLPLAHLAENRGVRITYKDLQSRPHRFINSPMWSGLIENGRAYAPFTYNVECLVPWRTLTGRQHFYLDHPLYLQFGEHLPTYKPKPLPTQYADLMFSKEAGPTKMLNYLTPHGKWHIHSTYGDNERMTTLSRGCEPLWISERDAAELGIAGQRLGRGPQRQRRGGHAGGGQRPHPARDLHPVSLAGADVLGAQVAAAGHRRAGGHNSLTRVRLKPNLMAGGYGQFTFHFNYWGPTGCNRDTHILVRKLPD
jgi:nitrate reductase / nitrite oxidoreductase, alpha subunit